MSIRNIIDDLLYNGNYLLVGNYNMININEFYQ